MELFKGKTILFGEYAILKGSMALALPLDQFFGILQYAKTNENNQRVLSSKKSINQLYQFIKDKNFNFIPDLQLFQQELNKGLWFNSNIPEGYGAGSSGALCAALFHTFFKPRAFIYENPDNLPKVKQDLALMESFFHGNSSGTDPLVSYLDRPLFLNASVEISAVSIPSSLNFFLIDSEIVGKTKPLVEFFNTWLTTAEFNGELQHFISLTNSSVDTLLRQKENAFTMIKALANFEKEHFKPMFPFNKKIQQFENEFKKTLTIKLCGSGGGGFFLGIVQKENIDKILKFAATENIKTYPLFTHDRKMRKLQKIWNL
jgi:mevalonate kinase